jgi:FkbM family methyltransferase
VFLSYAQNFEDVMLWRALKHVAHGFYIDVGAAWPEKHSVTKAFYDRDWQGINIEPNAEMWRLLEAERPRDINLKLALSDERGHQDFYILGDSGLSTLLPDVVALHEAGGLEVKVDRAEVSTLSDVWNQHVGARDVHFLKIDAEGAEREVLLGNDWSQNRPWILVIEATIPSSPISTHEHWEAIVLNAGYRLAYNDGLNRFYVAAERQEILPAFSTPPNVFDRFVLAESRYAASRALRAEARAKAAQAREKLAQERARLAQERARLVQERARLAQEEAKLAQERARAAEANARKAKLRLAEMRSTVSWRATRPFRRIAKVISRHLKLRSGRSP